MTKQKYKFVLPEKQAPPDVTELRPKLDIDEDGNLMFLINGVPVCWALMPECGLPLRLTVDCGLELLKDCTKTFTLEERLND